MFTNKTIRQKYLDFFKSKGHAIIPSASLIPSDNTVLFNTAGMQPLVPYLLGKNHPQGKRLADSQKCLRTDDILEVGDNRHLTFFEMLGNWSLGDYFKKESIAWSFELLTSKGWFNISPDKLYVTIFEGDKSMNVGQDDESIGYWIEAFKSVGVEASLGNRIYAYPKKKNWWELAGPGPCGPDTEIFYDTGATHNKAFGETCHVNCDCGKYMEIWNNVFMEYEKKYDEKGSFVYSPLAQKNVDTGMGFERITMVLQNTNTAFETDLFSPIIKKIESLSGTTYTANQNSFRIILDHLRASAFLIAEGILPSNSDRGYILRRLIRRSLRHVQILNVNPENIREVFVIFTEIFSGVYDELKNTDEIFKVYLEEVRKFEKALIKGEKEFSKLAEQLTQSNKKEISGDDAFNIYETYGLPIDLMIELAKEHGLVVDVGGFESAFIKHQDISRAGAEKKFGGHGMVKDGELSAGDVAELAKKTQLHTATHLLQQALRQVLGDHVRQKGSDINADRLRFDFSHSQKMTDEEKKKVEDLVNENIKSSIPVAFEELPIDEAEKTGALMFQKEKYGDKVKVYSIGDFSKELCGGPHVSNTKEISGVFKIQKEEASSSGVRRIKASLVHGG